MKFGRAGSQAVAGVTWRSLQTVVDGSFKIFLRKDVGSVFASLLACLVSAVRFKWL